MTGKKQGSGISSAAAKPGHRSETLRINGLSHLHSLVCKGELVLQHNLLIIETVPKYPRAQKVCLNPAVAHNVQPYLPDKAAHDAVQKVGFVNFFCYISLLKTFA